MNEKDIVYSAAQDSIITQISRDHKSMWTITWLQW